MNHERIDDKTFLVEIVDKVNVNVNVNSTEPHGFGKVWKWLRAPLQVSNDTAQEKCVIVAITILFWTGKCIRHPGFDLIISMKKAVLRSLSIERALSAVVLLNHRLN